MQRWFVIAVVLTSMHAPSALAADAPTPLTADTFAGLELRGIGPALMSGRIADIALDPTDPNVWYVGVGSGGVWKTVNAGTTWTPVFDDEDAYSIGCVTVDPSNPHVVWVGTGENVGGRHVGFGENRIGGLIREHPGVTSKYAARCAELGVMNPEQQKALRKEYSAGLRQALKTAREHPPEPTAENLAGAKFCTNCGAKQ